MTNAMTYRGYSATMTFDPEDHIIVGRVEGIDVIITFHAEAVKEFECHFHAVVGNLMLRIDPNLHAAALKMSHRQGLSLNKWAEQALRTAAESRVEG